jgi:hypothetical protein
MAWTEHGPVSVPSTPVVGVVAFLIGLAAIGGVGLGIRASWRDTNRPTQGLVDTQASGQAILAQPIVDLPQPQAAPKATNTVVAASNAASAADDSADIAQKTAAVQAAQSKPAQTPGNPDDILASPSEKPQAPAKPSTDEAPPSAPKSDVPF